MMIKLFKVFGNWVRNNEETKLEMLSMLILFIFPFLEKTAQITFSRIMLVLILKFTLNKSAFTSFLFQLLIDI